MNSLRPVSLVCLEMKRICFERSACSAAVVAAALLGGAAPGLASKAPAPMADRSHVAGVEAALHRREWWRLVLWEAETCIWGSI